MSNKIGRLKKYRKKRNLGVVILNLLCRTHPFSNKKFSLDELSCFVLGVLYFCTWYKGPTYAYTWYQVAELTIFCFLQVLCR